MLNLHTQLIAECHLAHCLCKAIALHSIGGYNAACLYIFKYLSIPVHNLAVVRQVILILCNPEHNNLTARTLELRGNHILMAVHIHGKGNQGRRNIDFTVLRVKGA